MPDALAILRRGHSALPNGILIPDVLVQACQLEDVPLPVGATIYEGESAGGKNIWGADGGLGVKTLGTYTPRTPVTKAGYLAYREKMRAKLIIRQGAGPCQCTSAQYQDTADALGGTWDPLANSRSGFRGMGALMKRYGTRDGARRYNGSGPNAEAYADRFMTKYNRWRSLGLPLDPHSVSTSAVVAPAAAAPVRKVEPVLANYPVVGAGALELNCPIKNVSALYGAAFLSVRSSAAAARFDAWWGLSDVGGRGEKHWADLPASARRWTELTGGDVDQLTVHYNLGPGVPGVITLELSPK